MLKLKSFKVNSKNLQLRAVLMANFPIIIFGALVVLGLIQTIGDTLYKIGSVKLNSQMKDIVNIKYYIRYFLNPFIFFSYIIVISDRVLFGPILTNNSFALSLGIYFSLLAIFQVSSGRIFLKEKFNKTTSIGFICIFIGLILI